MASVADASLGDAPMQGATMTLDPMDDDLFGEAAESLGMGIPLPSALLPPALFLRLAEMQRIGCCTKLAWSNTGSLALIRGNGGEITFRTLQRDQTTETWKTSDVSRHSIVAPEGRQFVHVQWSGLGIDLVTVDDLGAVQVYSMAGAIGRMQPAQGDIFSDDDHRSGIDAVVGLHWLPLYPSEFRSQYIGPVTKIENKWVARMKNGDQHGNRVHHPADNRSALLYVTRTNRLSLLYQNESAAWQAASNDLGVSNEGGDLLSHAAFAENGDHILLCTHDIARNFWLYRVTINWNLAQQSKGNTGVTSIAPTLEFGRLTTLEHVGAQHSETARLSHLRIVPTPPNVADQTPLLPTILAVFAHAPMPTNESQQHQESFSVIARWDVEPAAPILHESFAKLRPNGAIQLRAQGTLLTRHPDSISGKTILTVDLQYFNTIVALAASDGSIDFRDRATYNTIETYVDTTFISSLPQSGFEYMPDEHHLHVAHSTDGGALAFVREDRTFGTKVMSPRYGWQPLEDGIGDTKSYNETAIVCLARQYAILTASNSATDETLALLPPDLSPEMRVSFVREIFRVLNRNPDISMYDQLRQQQFVFKEPYIHRVLSAQMALGMKPGSTHRTFGGQFAYVQLNLRYISMALVQTLSRGQEGKPEVLPPLVGLVRWTVDLIIYIVESIIMPVEDAEPNIGDAKRRYAQTLADDGNPALHFLLCSFSRTLLRFHNSYIAVYLTWVQGARQKVRTVQERQQLVDVYDMVKSIPFTLAAFQDLIMEIDQAVRTAYTEANITPERRMELELAMMTEGHIPEELQPALHTLLHTSLPKLAESTDMSNLYFWNTEWLGISRSVPPAGAIRYDSLRKMPLPPGVKVRVCRRCGAETEDILPEHAKDLPPWVAFAQRQCYCLNYWWALS